MDARKVFLQRPQRRQHGQQRLGRRGLEDQTIPFFAHDGIFPRKSKLARDAHRLITAILENLDAAFRRFEHSMRHMPSICQTQPDVYGIFSECYRAQSPLLDIQRQHISRTPQPRAIQSPLPHP